jgi:molecular chaperone DnaK
MNEYAIGIDLGTSTSIVSVLKDGRPLSIKEPVSKSPLVPSVVAINKNGQLLTGHKALKDVLDPDFLIREAKRDMGTSTTYRIGEHTLRPQDVGALVLRKMKEIAEGYLGSEIRRAVITTPAYFTDIERRATLEAAELAGIEVIRLINEPTAAALAFGMANLEHEDTVLVFDMGGGTLDVTVLEMLGGVLDIRASDGDKHLGGKDIDALLEQWASDRLMKSHPGAQIGKLGFEKLKRAAEESKKGLSESAVESIAVTNIAAFAGAEVDFEDIISVETFNALIEPLVQKALGIIDKTLAKAGMTKSQIGKVLLVGGSTYVPRIRQAVLAHVGAPAISGVDPDLAVSQGAAISAALAIGALDEIKSVVYQDASTYGMGVLVVESIGHQEMLVYDALMAPSTPIPYMCKKRYSLRRPDQTELELDIVLDPTGVAKMPEETMATGTQNTIKDIPISLYGSPHEVEVTFSYDQNHTVEMTATVIGIGKVNTVRLNRGPELLGESGVNASFGRIEQLWATSPLADRHRSIIKRAEAVLAERPDRAEMIEAALVDLKTQIAGNEAEAAQAARDRLTDLLMEM